MAPGDTLQGQRVADTEAVLNGEPGDYAPFFAENGEVAGVWAKIPTGSMARLPNVGHGTGGPEWTVTVEDDDTVTVDPSIQQHEVAGHTEPWHGYLVKGMWREV